MKRLIAILFAVVLAVVLAVGICGCSQYKCRDEVKKFGESAIFYAEQYINGIILAEEAYENISVIADEFDEYLDVKQDDTLDSSMELCESTLYLEICNLHLEFFNEKYTGGEIANIKDEIEDIKKTISY